MTMDRFSAVSSQCIIIFSLATISVGYITEFLFFRRFSMMCLFSYYWTLFYDILFRLISSLVSKDKRIEV
jgi:hypothetical protein